MSYNNTRVLVYFGVGVFLALFFFLAPTANAAVTVTPASGGTNISADKAANATSPAYTTLGNITIAEGANGDFAAGTNRTLILTAPTNWTFSTGAGSVSFTANKNITAASIAVTSTTATVTYTVGGTNKADTMTISGLQVRSNDGALIPSAGNILRTTGNPGTGTIAGITNGSTNFGSLSQVTGNATKLIFSTQPGGAAYGSTLSPQPVVKSQDQFSNNTTTGLGASKTVTLTLSSGTGTLQGTVTLDIGTGSGNGTVTYTNVAVGGISATGIGKVLTAVAIGLTSAVSSSFAMTARAATLTGTRVYDTTTTVTFAILSVSNKVGSDDVTVASGSGTLASANVGAEAISSFGTLALGGTTASNYTISGASGTVTITKATPTLSVTNSPVTYTGAGQSAAVSGSVPGTASSILTGGVATQTTAGTYAVTANFTPTDITNYNSLTAASAGNFVINKATPTISVTNSPVTYSGSAQAAVVTGSVAGSVSSVLYNGSATVPTNAGTYAVTANFIPTDTTDYNSLTASSAGSFVINKANPTLSVTNSPITYDGAAHAATVSGSVPGTASNILTGGSATQTAAGTYAVTANFAPTDSTNYNSLTAASAGSFVISKATPTLSVTNSPVTYNAAPQGATVTGSVAGTVSNVKYNGSATVPTNATTYAITADFAPTDANYNSLTQASVGNFIINKATPTLSVTNSPVAYDGSAHAATVSGSVPGMISNILTGGATTQTAAGTYAATANFAPTDSTNYNSLTSASAGGFVISKVTATLSITNSPVTYNGSPQSAIVTGSVPGSVSNIKYAGSATVPTNAGTYAITADFAPTDSTNYNSLTGASAGNFVINNTGQTITFNVLSNKTYGDTDFTVSASASSGLTVSFASQTAGVCSVSGVTVHILSVGTCTVRASQAGDSNYTAAPNVDRSFTIATKNLTVSGITANDKPYDGNTTATLNVGSAALVGVVPGDTVSLNTGSVVGTFASPNPATGITITISGLTISGTSATNYSLTQPTTTATINNPVPTTTSISPTQIAVGSSGFTMTVNGTNFVASSAVLFNGSARATTFASSTQLSAQILTSDLTTLGTSTVAVLNGAPGGGTSNAQIFTVFTPVDVTAPVVTAFDIASTSTSLTVPVTAFTATDNVGVTGYLLTEASTTPSVGDSGWSATAPSNFIFASQGGKTLYAWAKDAAGNISTSTSATTIISLPDTTSPVITSFTLPTATSSLAVGVLTFTATDNVGVTGYLLTEASTAPSLGNTNWSGTAPTSYTFITQGDKTLYAWAKDAAGNISTSTSATVSITFTEVAPTNMQSLVTAGVMVPNGTVASSTQVTFNQEVHINYGGGTNVDIPFNSVLTAAGAADWTSLGGQLSVLTTDLPSTYSVAGTLQFGLASTPISLNQNATVKIAVDPSHNGETLTVFKKEAGGSSWAQSTTCLVASGICSFTTNSFSSWIVAFLKAIITPGTSSAPAGEAVAPTKVNFTGQAYPASTIEVFFKSSQDGQYRAVPQGTYTVSADGTFDVDYTGLFGGSYVFGLQATDKDGNKSGIVQASVNLLSENALIVRNLFLPPTLNLARTSIRLGDVISVNGYAASGSTVEFEIDGKLNATTVVAKSDGSYKSLINTAQFGYGTHLIRVRQKNADKVGGFSSNKAFSVSRVFFPLTDLNNDGKIDITDWSIFLSLWTSKDANARKRIDFNGDGKVDLADFSIFMQSLKAAANTQ